MTNDYMLSPIRSIKSIPYNDVVYNLHVTGENTYCTSAFTVHNCLPILEMMACGKQIVTTDYSGNTEFCTKDNSLLVDIKELEDAHDFIMPQWFHGQGQWASIGMDQFDQFVYNMQSIHNKKQNRDNLFNRNGVETAKNFSWENSAKTIVQHLTKTPNKNCNIELEFVSPFARNFNGYFGK